MTITQISTARHYSTLNISEMVQDKDISYNRMLIGTYARLLNGVISKEIE